MASIGILTIHYFLPGCTSLKQKRSLIKPVLARLHREFNVSTAEIDQQDMWQEAVIACAIISNDSVFSQRALQQIEQYTASNFPSLTLLDHQIEII